MCRDLPLAMAMRESWLVSGGVPSKQATIDLVRPCDTLANYYAICRKESFHFEGKSIHIILVRISSALMDEWEFVWLRKFEKIVSDFF